MQIYIPRFIFQFFQHFEAAIIPTRPFILELTPCKFQLFDNAETFYNQQTKEELSVQQNGLDVTIKRAKKLTKTK